MKDKLLDLGLLMALVIVALLVGITLYGPNLNLKIFSSDKTPVIQTNPNENLNSTNNSTTTSPSSESGNNNDSSGVQVVDPNSSNTTANTDTSVNTTNADNAAIVTVAPAPQNETSATSDSSSTDTAQTDTDPAEIQTVAAPLPEGSLKLQRIGFSYVTGGAGACGITLEAWNHVAVSRDILAKYPCGSTITINIDKPVAGHSSFIAIVGDTMNSKHSKTVNIYVGRDEPALEYGRQEGNLVP